MDVQTLLPKVIRSMQTNQQVRPTVYAQIDTQTIDIPLINFIGDSKVKANQLFLLGREMSLKYPDQTLQEAILITEVWLTPEKNPLPGQRPPANIPQKEAVMLARSILSDLAHVHLTLYEIKRDKKKKAQELVQLGPETEDAGLLGLAFFAGWKSRRLSEQEVQALQPRGMRAFLSL